MAVDFGARFQCGAGVDAGQNSTRATRPDVRPARLGLIIGQLTAGGAEGQLWLLCRGLDRAAISPIVYCLSDQIEPYGPLITSAGVPLRIISGRRLARLQKLRRWLDADRIDVVHAWLFIANAYAWAANRGGGRPLLTSARNCKRQGRVLDWLNRRAFAASHAIVTNSLQVAEYIEREYGAPRRRIRIIPNGIDTERFHPRDGEAAEVAGPIVAAGRLVEQKNHALFLRAAAGLARLVPQAQFVIAGDGPLRSALEEQARQLGIADRVRFAGERRDIDTLLRAGSILWLTSRWEGMPNIVLEAMASGLPVITTDVGGVRELIRSGVDGFVVQEGDAGAFVRHSQELLQPATRQLFAAAARARAEEFSTARMVSALSQLYDKTLGRNH
jgi:glycosyltransferase involved in cell wall biosynthesis